ncbi:MAG: isopeptide-forming domain-containing fimbrial protein, partial [Clostridiales bacterium]|nr:isopeptide-forming domain-containing fimbrial protein [Clostridiales bacterium]
MKKLKKLLSIVLAVAMVMSLAVTVSAYTITITDDTEDYEYTAYQVFAGDLTGTTLTNIVWGDDIDSTDETSLLTAIAAIVDTSTSPYTYPFANCSNASDVATALSGYTYDQAVVQAFADVIRGYVKSGSGTTSGAYISGTGYTISNLEAGYYLVENTSVPTTDGAYTRYLLTVVSDTPISVKRDVPSMTKKVQETNDSTGDVSDWQDVADYDIGDDVPFRLTGTVADNISSYNTYQYIFHDKMSTGLDFNSNSVVVTIYSIDGSSVQVDTSTGEVTISDTATGSVVDATCYEVITTSASDGCSFEIKFTDLKSATASGSSITIDANTLVVVTYTAELLDTADLGNNGNPNTAKLEYSNNPNWDGTGTEETGETPWDTVVVFTYEVVANKVKASDNSSLVGATFTLYKMVEETSTFDATKGYYTYDETTGEYTASIDSTAVTGTTYFYFKEVKSIDGTALSTFTFTGIDEGYYKLVETKEPDGYNKIDDMYFTVESTFKTETGVTPVENLADISAYLDTLTGTADTTNLGSTLINFSSDVTEGTVTTSVANSSGSTLPGTGGMGTTIFYVVGGVLVLGAVV